MYVFQANMLVVELKSEAVKERHWKQLMRRLRVSWVLSELTLGHLWDLDLLKNETVIRDVLGVAQGEMALEEFLKQVRNNSFLWTERDHSSFTQRFFPGNLTPIHTLVMLIMLNRTYS